MTTNSLPKTRSLLNTWRRMLPNEGRNLKEDIRSAFSPWPVQPWTTFSQVDVDAIRDAHNKLKDAILEGRVRLRGFNGSQHVDIECVDITADGLNILRDTLTARDRDKARTYTKLACYEEQGGGAKAGPTKRTAPEQTRALGALRELFGDEIPPRTALTDGDLVKKVNSHVKANGGRPISKESVLRAAGRRVDPNKRK